MDNYEFEKRREKLFDKLKDYSCALIFSSVAKTANADATLPYEVNRNFYYLTGIDQENCCLMLVKSANSKQEFLFIDEYDELKEKWTGKRLTSDEAKEISSVRNILLNNSLFPKINRCLSKEHSLYGEINNLYLDLTKEIKIGDEIYTTSLSEELKKEYNVKVIDIFDDIASLRMVKSNKEIMAIKEAIKITNNALLHLMNSLSSGKKEYLVANEFNKACFDSGELVLAFPTILASGKNSCCLHYPNPMDTIKKDSIVLCDLGARYKYYCADISRTYPSDGKYTTLQRKIYQIVLDCNKEVIKFIKPGKTIAELQKFTIDFMAGKCLLEGLINKPEDIKKYYFHNVSHHLGLDTHDVSFRDRMLEPGMIITVEPGLYFSEFDIGVRIEDDVLVTDFGSECLSKQIIKEIDDIENLLGSKK